MRKKVLAVVLGAAMVDIHVQYGNGSRRRRNCNTKRRVQF